MATKAAACTSSSTMPMEGISSGGSSAIGARLVPTKKPSNPSTMQSPVISMAESGSSGVTRASASRNGRSRGSPSPSPISSSSGPRTRSPREQDGGAREEQQHRGDAEEEIEPDQGGAIALRPVGPVGETERAQQRGRGRDQELDPVGHGFPYQSRDEVGSHRGVSRRTPAAASREYTSDGLSAMGRSRLVGSGGVGKAR